MIGTIISSALSTAASSGSAALNQGMAAAKGYMNTTVKPAMTKAGQAVGEAFASGVVNTLDFAFKVPGYAKSAGTYLKSAADTPLYDQLASTQIAKKVATQGYDQGYVDVVRGNVFRGGPATKEAGEVFDKVSGRAAYGKDETAGSVIDEALKNKHVSEYEAESMRHFFANEKNAGKEYTEGSIQNWFKNYNDQQTAGMSAKEASMYGSTALETKSPLNKLFGNETTAMGDLGGVAVAGLLGGVAGGLTNDNFEGGVAAGAIIGSMGKGIGRVINNNMRNIEESMISSVLGKSAAKEGDEFGEMLFKGYKDNTVASKAGLGGTTKYDPTTKKFLDASGKEVTPDYKPLTMEELGMVKADDVHAAKSDTLDNFTQKVIKEEQDLLDDAILKTTNTPPAPSTYLGKSQQLDLTNFDEGYLNLRQEGIKEATATAPNATLRSNAVKLNDKNVVELNPDFLKDEAAQGFMKNQVNMGRATHTKESARVANLRSVAAKDESELGYMGSYAKNKLTNGGGAGSIGMQSRYMAISGAMLGGVAFTSKGNDHRRGFNANRGNRI